LGEPEHDCLYFAGEAIAIDSNPQTVHGAINSGITAAKQCSLILSKIITSYLLYFTSQN